MHRSEFAPFFEELAVASKAVIVPHFGRPDLAIESKADASPVTIADRRAEEVMRSLINKRYPHHGIIGEEYGEERADADYVWVLDPIDGTVTFASGCPLFGTLIALLHEGKPVIGAIYQPLLDQLVIGDNRLTTLNGRPVRMRNCASLDQATLLTTDLSNIGKYKQRDNFERLAAEVGLFRTWGDCYGYLLLATGWADIMIDPIMKIWDVMALVPVIRGAGGLITTWEGGEISRDNISSVAAPQALHAQVIAYLNRDEHSGKPARQ